MKYELTYKGNCTYYIKKEDAVRAAKRLSKVYGTVCKVTSLDAANNILETLNFNPL